MKVVSILSWVAIILVVLGRPVSVNAQTEDQSESSTRAFEETGGSLFTPNVLPSLSIPRSESEIKIDAEFDELAWDLAAVATNFTEAFPDEGEKPPIGIRVLVSYDDDNLYIGYLIDDDPDAIRANYSDRDQIWSDDYVGILLDTNGDGQQNYFLASNPFGIQGDSFSSGDNEDSSFDLIYESAGKITESGYQVEFAIPFRSLRFPQADVKEWRATFWITHPRDSRNQYTWAAIDQGDPCFRCQLGYLSGLNGVKSGKNLEILPSVTGFQSTQLEDFSNPNSRFNSEQVDIQPSLGIKYGITSDLTADLTINPDFSQIEADVAQIDVNSTFALFFPERRPFFQEGSDLFDTKIQAVYTRTINEPIAATKLTGRVGNTSIGYIGARDVNSPVLLPFEESSSLVEGGKSVTNIFRARHSLGNSSFLGAMLTDRRLDIGGSGSLVALDGAIRFLTQYTFDFQAAFSQTTEADDSTMSSGLEGITFADDRYTASFDGESFGGHAIDASLGRGGRHWRFDVTYSTASATFRADNGFVTQNDRRQLMTFQNYTFYPKWDIIDRISPRVFGVRAWNFGGAWKEDRLSAGLQLQFKAQTNVNIWFNKRRELFNGVEFAGMNGIFFRVNSNFSERVGIGFSVRNGDSIARNATEPFIGDSRDFEANMTLRPTKRLVVEPSISFSDLKHPITREAEFSGYIGRARVNYQLTGKLLARVIVQYNDFSEALDVDPIVTYRVSPFTVFHLGSTHTYNTFAGQDRESSFLAQSSRQIFFKAQYLFQR